MEEINKSLKERQENQEKTIKQVKKIVQIIPDLKIEIESIKKTQTEKILELENLDKRRGTTEESITNRIQEMEERISGVEDTIQWSNKMLKPTNP